MQQGCCVQQHNKTSAHSVDIFMSCAHPGDPPAPTPSWSSDSAGADAMYLTRHGGGDGVGLGHALALFRFSTVSVVQAADAVVSSTHREKVTCVLLRG